MHKMTFDVQGVAPLMMHNPQLANPMNPWTKQMKEYTAKRKKTEEELIAMQRIEFLSGLYYDPKIGIHIPAESIDAMLVDGAKRTRRGKLFKAAVYCLDPAPLIYEGPRDPEELWEQGTFADVRPARVQQSVIMRCRPIFREWRAQISVVVQPDAGVDPRDVREAITTSGTLVGILEMRPKYGRFTAKEVTALREERVAA